MSNNALKRPDKTIIINDRRSNQRAAPGFHSRRGHKLVEGLSRSELVEAYSAHVKTIARKMAQTLPTSVDFDDLVSVGLMGLLDAADKFDQSRGFKFKTYAEFRIRGAILDELRNQDFLSRRTRDRVKSIERTYQDLEQKNGKAPSEKEIGKVLGLSLEKIRKAKENVGAGFTLSYSDLAEVVEQDQTALLGIAEERADANPFNNASYEQTKKMVERVLQALTDRERLVLACYYYRGLTIKEISTILDVTEARTSQLHSQAIFRLKSILEADRKTSMDLFMALLED
jgi:RNA polymerase sigma factor FliA